MMQWPIVPYTPSTSSPTTDSRIAVNDPDMAHLTHMALLTHEEQRKHPPPAHMALLTQVTIPTLTISRSMAHLTQTPKSAG